MYETSTNTFGTGESGPSVINYQEYRELRSAASTSFRELGLISQPLYEAAANDSTTKWGVYEGKRLPWLVSIDYAAGYDAARCRQLTQRAQTYLLTISSTILSGLILETHGPLADAAVIVESPASEYIAEVEALTSQPSFNNMHPADFIDPTIADETKRVASMSVFKGLLQPVVEGSGISTTTSLSETWQQYRANPTALESIGNDGAKLLTAEDLAADDRLVDELWEICESRFGELGEFHPVSMEESREFFLDMLLAEGTSTIIKYDHGRPVCFGMFQEDISACTWLSEAFRQKIKEEAATSEQAVLYYPELISRKGAQAQSAAVIDLASRLIAERQRATLVVFETTNRSSVYVPRLVKRYVEGSGVLSLSNELIELDQLRYWYLTA